MVNARARSALLLFSAVLALVLGTMMPATAADPQPRHLDLTVTDLATDAPLPGIDVQLYTWSGEDWQVSGTAITTDAAGHLATDITLPSPADLTVGFTDPGGVYSAGFGTDGTLAALPTGPSAAGTFHYGVDFTDLVLTATLDQATRQASGAVTTAGGGALSHPLITVYRWNETESVWSSGDTSTGAADGTFAVSVPGRSTVTFRIARPGYQSTVLGGGDTLPSAPDATNSRLVGDADLDLGTFELRPPDLGRVAGLDLPYCTANILPANDDGSTNAIDIPFALTFFGTPYTQLFVNNNGNVTFNGSISQYTPSDLTGDTGQPIIAPFFADVDTRGAASAQVTYGASDDGSSFCVNWADVGYYGNHSDKLNTFQLILTANTTGEGRGPGDFDITFNYDRVLWETGDASSGSNGFGGTSAAAGFSAGTGLTGTFVQLPGSFENGALLDGGGHALVSGFQGTITPGRYLFQVRNSGIAETLGGLHGTVKDTTDAPVAGAFVQACRATGNYCRPTVTTDQGTYAFTGLPVGDYALSVSPPAGSSLFPGAGSARAVAGVDTAVADIVLQAPRPMPSGVTLTNADPDSGLIDPYVPASGPPVVHYMADLNFAFDGCPAVVDPTVVETVGGVVVNTVALTEAPAGHYAAVIPRSYPAHGEGSLTTNVSLTCGGDPVGFDIYIDPSGVVTDQYGRPIDGATVQLQRADAGTGPFAAVADGSAVMSPSNRTNPVVTDATGFFRWDVLSGWYRVQASATGCTDTTSDAMEIPPARLDLLVKMACGSAPMPVPTTAPVLSGTPTVGQALSVTTGTWGSGLVFEKVEWLRGGTVVGTGLTRTLTAADAGQRITARVYAKRPDYTQENGSGAVVGFASATYDVQSDPVAPGAGGVEPSAPVNTVAPAVTGAAKVGRTLTATPGTWDTTGLAFAYQWKRDGQPISGATGVEHAATVTDLGTQLTVTVRASKAGLPDGTATSAPVTIGLGDPPEALVPPVISGEAVPGGQLLVSPGTWDVADLELGYQWLRDGEPIDGATASAHTVTQADQGTSLGVLVTARREGYADGSAAAEPVSVPLPPQPGTVTSVTTAKLVKSTIRAGHQAELRIRVTREDGSPATGPYEVKVDGRTVISRRLHASDGGRTTVLLPKRAPGIHQVRVRYLGSPTVAPSRSEVLRLTVRPRVHQHPVLLAGHPLLPSMF